MESHTPVAQTLCDSTSIERSKSSQAVDPEPLERRDFAKSIWEQLNGHGGQKIAFLAWKNPNAEGQAVLCAFSHSSLGHTAEVGSTPLHHGCDAAGESTACQANPHGQAQPRHGPT